MKIKDVNVRVHNHTYTSSLRNQRHPWLAKNAVVVFVETDSGIVGIGEAWCDRGNPETVVKLIELDLKPLILGEPLWKIGRMWERMRETDAMSVKGGALYAAISGVDIALWDAFARSMDMPLYRLLGAHTDSLPVYASGGMYGDNYSPNDLARDMHRGFDEGCSGVKIKGGFGTIPEEVARVSAVRNAIGPDAWLMLDALFSLDVPKAIQLIKALDTYNLRFFEAPVAREDLRGWAEIRAVTGAALSGPEVEHGLDAFRRALEVGAVDFLQADATICGGISEIQRIGALAAAFHRRITFHSSGSAIGLAANAHAGAAVSCADSVEFHLIHQSLFDSLWDAGYTIKSGSLHLPDRPGLGLDIDVDDPIFLNN